jgi:hypothetical protein
MNLQQRIDLVAELGNYLLSDNANWLAAKQEASIQNRWFTEEFINAAVDNISTEFLQKDKLERWCGNYELKDKVPIPKNIGLVMAGNIPLVGFHDFLCTFISGHRQTIKPSAKDQTLIKHIFDHLCQKNTAVTQFISFADMLKGCDAYIATGSNNSSRYFEYYFGKYPHIIRRNRTSVGIIEGNEDKEELKKLASDISMYFGLGCRNVTKVYVPHHYDFLSLLQALEQFDYFIDYHKFKNNYDYQLALLIMNNKYYMTNGSCIITESKSLFSAISVLHFEYYINIEDIQLRDHPEIQCIAGRNFLPFGATQKPSLVDYADGVDTMRFLTEI